MVRPVMIERLIKHNIENDSQSYILMQQELSNKKQMMAFNSKLCSKADVQEIWLLDSEFKSNGWTGIYPDCRNV